MSSSMNDAEVSTRDLTSPATVQNDLEPRQEDFVIVEPSVINDLDRTRSPSAPSTLSRIEKERRPSGNAVDIILIKGKDGYYYSTPWHIMFSWSSFKTNAQAGVGDTIDIYVNDRKLPVTMTLMEYGRCVFNHNEPDNTLPQMSAWDRFPLVLDGQPNFVRFEHVRTTRTYIRTVECNLYVWGPDDFAIIADLDGTITIDDVGGHIRTMRLGQYDYIHAGSCGFFSKLHSIGARIFYLTARPINWASGSRIHLKEARQGGDQLPPGPVITNSLGLAGALFVEVVHRNPDVFKAGVLKQVQAAMAKAGRSSTHPVFVAGFGNRPTDIKAYTEAGIDPRCSFLIDPTSSLTHSLNNTQSFKSYTDPLALMWLLPKIKYNVPVEFVRKIDELTKLEIDRADDIEVQYIMSQLQSQQSHLAAVTMNKGDEKLSPTLMSWIDEWKYAEIEIDIERAKERDQEYPNAIAIIQGETTTIQLHLRPTPTTTDIPQRRLSYENWYKYRSGITITCILQWNESIIWSQVIEFEPNPLLDASDIPFGLDLKASCVLNIDSAYQNKQISMAIQFKFDSIHGTYRDLEQRGQYTAINTAVMNYTFWPDTIPRNLATRDVLLPTPLCIRQPLRSIVELISYPSPCIVLQLQNIHPTHSISIDDAYFHHPAGIPDIELEPSHESFPAIIVPLEAYNIVWFLPSAAVEFEGNLIAEITTTWHLSHDDTMDRMTFKENVDLINLTRQPTVTFTPPKPFQTDFLGKHVSVLFTISSAIVEPDKPFILNVCIVNHTNESINALLLLPWQRYDIIPPAGNASLLGMTSQWVDEPARFVSKQAIHVVGSIHPGSSCVVAVEATAIAYGSIQLKHAVVYDVDRQVFYRQNEPWEFVALTTG